MEQQKNCCRLFLGAVRACVRACACVCARACVCVRACVRACVVSVGGSG